MLGLPETAGKRAELYMVRHATVSGVAVTGASVRERHMVHYLVAIRRVGATVLVGAIGEIENVSQVFQPDGRLAASNSP